MLKFPLKMKLCSTAAQNSCKIENELFPECPISHEN